MNRKLTLKQAQEMRKLKLLGWKLKDLAKRYNISITAASRICCGETYLY